MGEKEKSKKLRKHIASLLVFVVLGCLSVTVALFSDRIAASFGVTAQYPSFEVTYDANGGNFGEGIVTNVVEYEDGTAISGEYKVPGHELAYMGFQGWYTDSACTDGKEFDPDTDIAGLTENITVYAKWVVTRVKVTYNANGGNFGKDVTTNIIEYQSGTVTSGEYKIPEYAASYMGFDGWYTDAEATYGNEFDISTDIAGLTKDIVVYAKWKAVYPVLQLWGKSSTADFHHGDYKKKITTAEIVDSASVPDNVAAGPWDVSAEKNGSVTAWLTISTADNESTTGTDETTYHLTIAGNGYGKIFSNEDSSYAFYNFESLSSLTGANIVETGGLKDSKGNWLVNPAKKMIGMFARAGENAASFITDLSSWDTSYVTSMKEMFYYTGRDAETFDIGNIGNWNVGSVTNMASMFEDSGLSATNFDISNLDNWDTSSVGSFYHMFNRAGKFATTWNIGNIGKWDTSSVHSFENMFYEAGYNATIWDIGNLNTKTVTREDGTTYTAWDVSSAGTMKMMFQYSGYSATTWNIGDLSNWVPDSVTNMSYMFSSAGHSATTWNIGNTDNWDVSSVTTMESMFNGAGHDATTWNIGDISKWNTSKVKYMNLMFSGAGYSATNWDIGNIDNWDVSLVTTMEKMFLNSGYKAKTWNIGDISKWNTASLSNVVSMFEGAGYSASTFNIGNLNTKIVTETDGSTYIAWNVSKVNSLVSMFYKAGHDAKTWNIGDISNWDTSSVKLMTNMFYDAGYKADKFDIGNIGTKEVVLEDETTYTAWDVSSVTQVPNMFRNAGYSASIWNIGDIGNWNTNSINRTDYMFNYAGYKATIWNIGDLSNWKTSAISRAQYMFSHAGYSATTWNMGDIGNWDLSKLTSSNYSQEMFSFTPIKKLTIPVSLKVVGRNFASYCQNLVDITFLHTASDSIELPAAGGSYGAFFVGTPYSSTNLLMTNVTTENDTVKAYLWNTDRRGFPVNVIYDANGGTIGDEETNTVKYNPQKKTVIDGTYADPTQGGKEFAGWYTNKDCTDGNEFDVSTYEFDLSKNGQEINVYAKWNLANIKVTYDANGQTFEDGSSTNVVEYKSGANDTPVISKTSNVSDDGSDYGSGYDANLATTDVVTIPGAAYLEVTVTYATYSYSTDWVAIYDGSVTPSATNYLDSISNRLGGGKNTKTTKTYKVPGDTVQLFFKSNGSANAYYGYYAEVKPIMNIVSGEYTEPEHELSYWGFDGWYTEADCAEGKEFDLSTITEDITVYAKWEERIPVLYKEGSTISNNTFHSADYKTKITTAEIVDSATVPDNVAAGPWDVSEKQNGSVTAWLTTEDDGTTYHLTIAGNGYGKVFANEDSSWWFNGFKKLKTLSGTDILEIGGLLNSDGKTYKVNPVKSISVMFSNCPLLTELNIGNWDTSSVTDMNAMFSGCSSLSSFGEEGISNWDTSSVTTMESMFQGTKALKELNLKNWNVESVTTMESMFAFSGITVLDADNWNPINVTDMGGSGSYNQYGMFYQCSSLTEVKSSNWKLSNVTDLEEMFRFCSKLTTLNTSNWDLSSAVNMREMFDYCTMLPTIDVSKWNTGSVTDMYDMFMYCESLTTLDVSKWDTSSVTTMEGMFTNCESLLQLDVSNWDISSVTTMESMFSGCNVLKTLGEGNTGNWDTSSVTTMKNMFYGCHALTELDVATKQVTLESGTKYIAWDTSSVTNMHAMFAECYVLKTLGEGNTGNWDTSSVTTMEGMFSQCKALTELDVATKQVMLEDGTKYIAWDTSSVTTMGGMFSQCNILTELDVSKWDTSSVTNMRQMFYYCYALTELDVATKQVTLEDGTKYIAWDTSSVIGMNDMFARCDDVKELDVSKWDTSSVTNMNGMFESCTALTELDVATKHVTLEDGSQYIAWDISSVTTMGGRLDYNSNGMFEGCTALKTLDVSNWDTSSVTMVGKIFKGCSSLAFVDISKWDLSGISELTSSEGVFYECTALTELTLPASLSYFGKGFAYNCTSLKDITFLHAANETVTLDSPGHTYFTCGPFRVGARTADTTVLLTTNVNSVNDNIINYDWATDLRDVTFTGFDSTSVIYEANGGSFGTDGESGENITTNTVVYKYQTDLPTSNKYIEPVDDVNFKRFVGWYTDVDCTTGNEFDINNHISSLTEDITVYAKWEDISFTVTYNSNNGTFGTEANNLVDYSIGVGTVTKISKTSNVSDDGSDYGSGYDTNLSTTDVVTIPGAKSLDVTITYQTYNIYGDSWVAVYDNSIEPTSSNFDESISKRLGGQTKATSTFIIPGDTTQIYFTSKELNTNFYGYYATITGNGKLANATSGTYSVPTYDGYEFAGWYTDAACTDGNEFDVNAATSDVTVYAKWVESTSAVENLDLFPEKETDNSAYWQNIVNAILEGETEFTLDSTLTEMPVGVVDSVSYMDAPITFMWNEQTFIITQDTINDYEYDPNGNIQLAELAEKYAVVEESLESEDVEDTVEETEQTTEEEETTSESENEDEVSDESVSGSEENSDETSSSETTEETTTESDSTSSSEDFGEEKDASDEEASAEDSELDATNSTDTDSSDTTDTSNETQITESASEEGADSSDSNSETDSSSIMTEESEQGTESDESEENTETTDETEEDVTSDNTESTPDSEDVSSDETVKNSNENSENSNFSETEQTTEEETTSDIENEDEVSNESVSDSEETFEETSSSETTEETTTESDSTSSSEDSGEEKDAAVDSEPDATISTDTDNSDISDSSNSLQITESPPKRGQTLVI